MKLRHFETSEFACKCGCGGLPSNRLMMKMDELREQFGLPLIVTSGFRCESYNARVGGAKNSYHKRGLACDVRIAGNDPNRDRLLLIAGKIGFRGVGNYASFTHLDLRRGFANWRK